MSQNPFLPNSPRRPLSSAAVLSTLFMLGLALAPSLFAQDAAAEAGKVVTMLDQFKAGGWWMAPIYLLSVGSLTLMVYNFLQLTKAKFIPDQLRLVLLDHMQNCRVRSAIEVCSMSPTYLGRMMANALPSIDATEPETLGREAVEDQMAEFTIRENRGHMEWIGYFSVIAQAAPMLGLLGTVVGMMAAFAKLSATAGAAADKLAGDISLALVTTMGGLCVAIPSIIAFFFFKNRVNKLVAECHAAAGEMLDASIAAVNADQHMAKVPEGLSEH